MSAGLYPTAEEIARALGGHKVGCGFMCRCPAHADRTPSLSIRDREGDRPQLKCFAGCDWRSIVEMLENIGIWPDRHKRGDIDEASLQRQHRARKAESDRLDDEARACAKVRDVLRAKQIIRESVAPTPESVVGRYLIARQIPPPWPSCIREHCRLYHRDEAKRVSHHPAMIAPIRDVRTNTLIGVHRTWLGAAGGKADVDRSKKVLGGSRDGAVKLSANQDVTVGLGLTEGIEDGLDVLRRGWAPIWATLGTANLAAFPVLAGVDGLTIFADANMPGLKAAADCARRWGKTGRSVNIIPPAGAEDWNGPRR